MLVAGDVPRREAVTLPAVCSKAFQVRVLAVVAPRAVEHLARRGRIELLRPRNSYPGLERGQRGGAVGVGSRGAGQRARPHLRQLDVIDGEGANARTAVLDMTRRTLGNARVKFRRLASEEPLGVGMARRALRDRHSHRGLVTGAASVAEEGVPNGEGPGPDEPLQRGGGEGEVHHRQRCGCERRDDQREPERERLHRSHRNPK